MKFSGWAEHGIARFKGRFVLKGTFSYGCPNDCGEPPDDAYYQLEIEPDAAIAARLPYWNSSGEMSVIIVHEKPLIQTILSPRQRDALRAGKVPYVTGRTAIIVDEFETGFSCDAPYWAARFVAMAKTPKLARAAGSGVGSCA